MLVKRPAATLPLVTLLLLAILSLGAGRWQEPADQGHAHEHEEEGPLVHEMESLKEHMRALRKTLGDPTRRAESVEHARIMMNNALEAMKHWPPAPAGFSAVDMVKWRVDFQRKLLSVCDHMLQIELALAEGRQEDARNLYRAVTDIKQEGHDTYDPEHE